MVFIGTMYIYIYIYSIMFNINIGIYIYIYIYHISDIFVIDEWVVYIGLFHFS